MVAHCRNEHQIQAPMNFSDFFDRRWKFRQEFCAAFFEFFPSEDFIGKHLPGSNLGEIWPKIFHRHRLVVWYRCVAPNCFAIAHSPAAIFQHIKIVHQNFQKEKRKEIQFQVIPLWMKEIW